MTTGGERVAKRVRYGTARARATDDRAGGDEAF
jgi:hypothetical protein